MAFVLNEEDAGVPWIPIVLGKSETTVRGELWVAPPMTHHTVYVDFLSQKDDNEKAIIPTFRGNRLCLLLFSWPTIQLSA